MYEFFRELLASEQPVLERFNIVDPTAVGNNVRSITLAYTPSTSDSPTSSISLFWTDSKNKVYEKSFQEEHQAKSLYAAMQSDLKQASNLTRDEKMEQASSLVKSLLKRYAIYTDDIIDGNPAPVTTTNATKKVSHPAQHSLDPFFERAREEIAAGSELAHDVAAEYGQMFDNVKHMKWFVVAVADELRDNNNPEDMVLSEIQNPLINKTAKVVMQNLFFETPDELMAYQEKMKKNKAPGTDAPKPAGDFHDDLAPGKKDVPPMGQAEDGLAPGSLSYEDYEKQKGQEQKSLTKRIEQEVKDQVQSALEQKIASTFDSTDDDLIDAMRGKGRTWEEIKDYMVKELKYDKDSVAAYIDAMKESEMGTAPKTQQPGVPPTEKPTAPKPPTDLVSPETHDQLVKEVTDKTTPTPDEEHEIPQQDVSMAEIAAQDTEIHKIAEEPLETTPKARPDSGGDFDFLPDKNDSSDDMQDDPASQPDPGDTMMPNISEQPKIGDTVWVSADYETGREGFQTKLLATYKSNGEDYGVVAMGEHESKDFPMRFLKKAFFGRLVRLVTARKQQRATEKATAELKAIQDEIKKISAELQKEAASRADANAWVRKWIDQDEYEYDPKIEAILAAGGADKAVVAKAIAKRIEELLHSGGYGQFEIQNMDSPDITIDWDDVYDLMDKHEEREKEKKSEAEWQSLQKALQTETDPAKKQQIQQRIEQLENESSKKDSLTVKAAPPKPTRAVPVEKPVQKTEPEVVGPTISPKKIAPPDMRKEQPAMVPSEAQAMWDKLKDVQIKLSKIQQAALSIQQKADEDIKRMREESGQFALEQEELQHTNEVFQIVAALEKPVVEFRDFLAQVINQKEKVPVKWSYADKLNYLIEIMPELEKKLENAINGAQAHAKTVHRKELKTFPKAESFQLSKYDKKAAPMDMLEYVIENLKGAWDLVKGLMTPKTPEEGGAVA